MRLIALAMSLFSSMRLIALAMSLFSSMRLIALAMSFLNKQSEVHSLINMASVPIALIISRVEISLRRNIPALPYN